MAAEAVAWGSPVLESAVSTVAHGRLWYRGVDAVELAEHAALEETAALLWQSGPVRLAPDTALRAPAGRSTSALQALYLALAWLAGQDLPMQGRGVAALHAEGATLAGVAAGAVLGAIQTRMGAGGRRERRVARASAPLHQRLAGAWGRPRSADLIRRALVLLADHELNASTFATRVAASTGAPLAACVLAGLATLSGPLHGTAASGFARLAEAAARDGAAAALRGAIERGEKVAAFGHPLYPQGDIRAQALLQGMVLPPVYQGLQEAGEEIIGEHPNVDFALAALAAAARLPADAPFVLFALARITGWIAHALEQQQRGSLIRPRARYTGPALGAR